MHILPGETPEQFQERYDRVTAWIVTNPKTAKAFKLPTLEPSIAPFNSQSSPKTLATAEKTLATTDTQPKTRKSRSKGRLLSCGQGLKQLFTQIENNNRRAAQMKASGSITPHQWIELCAHCGNVCLGCGKAGLLTIDHIIALEMGGNNDIKNIQPLCRSCNSRKGMKELDCRPPTLLEPFFVHLP